MSGHLPPVKLDNFEGPFDLLIELAQTRRIDISTISLADVTDEFLTYIHTHQVTPAHLADFLIVAATLLLLKTRHLLPTVDAADEAEMHQLTDRVAIYRLYRTQALALSSQWRAQLFPGAEVLPLPHQVPWPSVTREELAGHMLLAIDRAKVPVRPTRHLRVQGKTIAQCVALLKDRLKQSKQFHFQEALAGQTRDTVAVSFLAALELARKREVTLSQQHLFDTLKVVLNRDPL